MRTTITLQVDAPLLDRLDAEAQRLDASRSYAARRLLAQALDLNRKPATPAGRPSGPVEPA